MQSPKESRKNNPIRKNLAQLTKEPKWLPGNGAKLVEALSLGQLQLPE